jgi:undecaprenyl-diphosphatase
MNLLQSIVLGVLQGVTEWLPISSQGQSVLVMVNFLQIELETALRVAIFLHIGTMLAVLIKFKEDFVSMLNRESKLLKIIIVATASTALTALPLLFFIKSMFESGEIATALIGIMLIITGVMLGTQRRSRNSYRSLDEITTHDMILAGIAQGFSILPGISRSGTTITILLMRGIKQDLALKLSFLMSAPAVLGALVLFDIWDIPAIAPGNAAIMVLSALTVGYITMSFLLRFAARANFAIFCISLGGLTLLLSLLPILF